MVENLVTTLSSTSIAGGLALFIIVSANLALGLMIATHQVADRLGWKPMTGNLLEGAFLSWLRWPFPVRCLLVPETIYLVILDCSPTTLWPTLQAAGHR
jgi:hypothetical protein